MHNLSSTNLTQLNLTMKVVLLSACSALDFMYLERIYGVSDNVEISVPAAALKQTSDRG